jgi:hypothetical protein
MHPPPLLPPVKHKLIPKLSQFVGVAVLYVWLLEKVRRGVEGAQRC